MSAITDSESNYDLCRIRFSNRNVLPQKKSFRKKSLGDLNLIENNNRETCNRVFLVEAPCAMGPPHLPLNAKPRHLFLFSDLLLVAKPRSTSSFKLKVITSILINFASANYPEWHTRK